MVVRLDLERNAVVVPVGPTPIDMIPAFSPGPCTTSFERVGSFFRWTRELLYEQCSLHITEKIPNSVILGSRPSMAMIRSYSSGVSWWAWTTSGVMVLIVLSGVRESGDQRFEYLPSVHRPHQRIASSLRVRHHSHHVALFAQDASDIAE